MESHELKSIPDDELLRRLSDLVRQSRCVEAELVAHISEVDERRLYLGQAMPSMFAYCTQVLRLSEAEAYLRIAAARAARRYPMVLTMLADGRLHLSGIERLGPKLTPENHQALLQGAAHKSKREIEELLAGLEPRPDAPALIRKVKAPQVQATHALQLRPDGVTPPTTQLRPDGVGSSVLQLLPGEPAPPVAPARSAVVEPLGRERFKVQFTASAELRAKLERLQALMRSSAPEIDLAAVIEAAVTEKVERLEARRFGVTRVPRKTVAASDTSPSSRHIPAAVRRAVYERDGGQCTFADARGRRCPERHRLEFHHADTPYARGGDHSVSSLRLACRSHNLYWAELEYGKDVTDQHRRTRGQVSEASVGRTAGRGDTTLAGRSGTRGSHAAAFVVV
jgi:hypothetical protein